MKTNVHINSIESYRKTPKPKLEEQIIAYSLNVRHFTTTMVAERLGEKQSTLVSKINKLLESKDLVKEMDKHPCAITGHNAMWFYNPKFTNQLRLM
jgi:ubiquinone/menaquinone biosynthesis C-methylase UbiE